MARLKKLVTTDEELAVGDRVLVGTTQEPGEVKFKGKTDFSEGEWVGVALDQPLGKNDGTVKDKRYFECPAKHGLFVRRTALIKVSKGEAVMKPPVPVANPKKKGATLLLKGFRNGEVSKVVDKMEEAGGPPPTNGTIPTKSAASAPASPAGGRPNDDEQKVAPTIQSPVSLPSPQTRASSRGFAVDDEQKAAALTELRLAVEERDLGRIRRAIQVATARGISSSEVDSAQRILNFENQKMLSIEIDKIRAVATVLADSVAKTQERASGIEQSVKADPSQSALGPWVTNVVQLVEQRLWTSLEERIDAKIDLAVKKVTAEFVKAGVEPKQLKITAQTGREHAAAAKIQASVRGRQARQLQKRQGAAITKLQAAWRGKMARAKLDTNSLSSAVKLARRRYEAWASIYDDSLAGKSGLDVNTFHAALSKVNAKYTPGQTSAIFKGYTSGTDLALIDLPGFCGIAEACSISDKMAAEFADINLDTFMTLGKTGAAEAATKVQSAARGRADRAMIGKRTEAVKKIQKFVRKQQANATASGNDVSKIAKVARRRYAAWAEIFDEVRGEAAGLDEPKFQTAMRQIGDKVSLGQISALFKGYCKGTGNTSLDLRAFGCIVEAVALGPKAAAEFADINIETYEKLGSPGADEAALKLQAVEKGRQVRANAQVTVKCRSCGNTGTDFAGNPCTCSYGQAKS